jgi:hypothetical protein
MVPLAVAVVLEVKPPQMRTAELMAVAVLARRVVPEVTAGSARFALYGREPHVRSRVHAQEMYNGTCQGDL